MVDHRRRDEWTRPRRGRPRHAGDEPDEEQALLDLQEQAGNRAVTGALEAMQDGSAPAPASQADSPGLRLLAALRSGPVSVQRQAAGGLIRRGMRGPEVEALQAELGAAGYPLAVDGIFGPRTQAAVVAFQRAAGLAADGIVGPATRGALSSGGKEAGKEAGKGSVEKEAWVPAEKEEAAKKEGSVEKEAWVPAEKEEEAAKEAVTKESGAKEAGIEKDDWWLT